MSWSSFLPARHPLTQRRDPSQLFFSGKQSVDPSQEGAGELLNFHPEIFYFPLRSPFHRFEWNEYIKIHESVLLLIFIRFIGTFVKYASLLANNLDICEGIPKENFYFLTFTDFLGIKKSQLHLWSSRLLLSRLPSSTSSFVKQDEAIDRFNSRDRKGTDFAWSSNRAAFESAISRKIAEICAISLLDNVHRWWLWIARYYGAMQSADRMNEQRNVIYLTIKAIVLIRSCTCKWVLLAVTGALRSRRSRYTSGIEFPRTLRCTNRNHPGKYDSTAETNNASTTHAVNPDVSSSS